MEYKRVTERKTKACTVCRETRTCPQGICWRETIYNRLQELEDKIEQGTLVDTESYFIVEENQWAGKNRFLVCQNAIQLAVCDFCETREEAEKSWRS